jgi:sulfate adenylyltransferase
MASTIIEPHGGTLQERLVKDEELEALKEKANGLKSLALTDRQTCDLEMIMNGAFSPLDGFLKKADYDSVCKDLRMADGTVWPMPITLDVSEEFAEEVKEGDSITLTSPQGLFLAVLDVADKWTPDKKNEAQSVFATTDEKHPAVNYLFNTAGPVYLGGTLHGLELPMHFDYGHLRHTPRNLRDRFKRQGWHNVVAFQTRNPMHRAHQELTFRAAQSSEANLLIHPVVGMTKPGDIDHYSRVRCYEKLLKQYPDQTTALSLLPLAMRMGGPREALWHAIIRKNYGCTHFIVGRDHAGPGNDSKDQPFYGPYEAQELVKEYQEEIGMEMVPFRMMVYVEDRAGYMPIDEVTEDQKTLNISGTEFRRRLMEGLEIPEWFSYPEVVDELRKTHPPKHEQGFTVFFTGLLGAGKATIANALRVKLLEMGGRPITLLDGKKVQKYLSSELDASKEDKEINIKRIGFVASEITKAGGVAICTPIAPYAKVRDRVREMVAPQGGFIEVYVSTPLKTCEERDTRGLYEMARSWSVEDFTGISEAYEAPKEPELDINMEECSPDEAAQRILLKLEQQGYIK